MATNNITNNYSAPQPLVGYQASLLTPMPNATGDGTTVLLACDNTIFTDGNYDTLTGIYTAPRDGVYIVSLTITFQKSLSTPTDYTGGGFRGDGQQWLFFNSNVLTVGAAVLCSNSSLAKMTAGQTFQFYCEVSGPTKDVSIQIVQNPYATLTSVIYLESFTP